MKNIDHLNNLIFKENNYYTKDLITSKKRLWDPNRSKVCAALKKNIKSFPIKDDSKILYLGVAEGYTISYISDIIPNGLAIGVDISAHSMLKFYLLCKQRYNLAPILKDANKLEEYKNIINFKFDIIIQDIAQKEQLGILIKNADLFLKEKGYVMLSLKTTAISQGKTKNIINEQLEEFKKYFKIIDKKRLDPFEKKHIFIVGQKK
jgi:fibrillarin-like pre-rRNA processing protein